MTSDLFITGTDTGVGKTLVSSLLVAALNRSYWKPIQTGSSEGTDRQAVLEWAGIPADRAHPEAYMFEPPVSPHLAAEQKGIQIDLDHIKRPRSLDPLIIEGAGGVLVPINSNAFMVDLVKRLEAPLVIVSRTALGTINHTLLTIAAARNAGLAIRGVVLSGQENPDNRRAVERYGSVPVIGWVPRLDCIHRATLLTVFDRHFDAGAFE
jgi:dethiobiotin synthase